MPMNVICRRFWPTSRNHTSNTLIKIFWFFRASTYYSNLLFHAKSKTCPMVLWWQCLLVWSLFGL